MENFTMSALSCLQKDNKGVDIKGFGGMGCVVGGKGALTACVKRDKYMLFSKYDYVITTNIIMATNILLALYTSHTKNKKEDINVLFVPRK